MIRCGTLHKFLFGIGVLTISLSAGALSKEPISTGATSADQAKQTDVAHARVSAPDGEITDANHMLRLENASETGRAELGGFETELKKAQAEAGSLTNPVSPAGVRRGANRVLPSSWGTSVVRLPCSIGRVGEVDRSGAKRF